MNTALAAAIDVGSRTIRRVEPLGGVSDVTGSRWACTRCARSFPVADSYAVVFDSSGRDLAAVVCPDCADDYRVPRPVTLDLDRLPPPDHATTDMRSLAAHVWFVSNARSRPTGGGLRIRDADVRRLAAEHHETPAALIDRLADRGLLTSS